jgi:hypothetical protein
VLEKPVSELNSANRHRVSFMRVIAGGALWSAVYNLVWGVAWFTFMREEWRLAFASIKRPLPFTADVWILWIALTVPIGVAIVAFAADPERSIPASKAIAYADATLWVLMTIGMAAWALQASLPIRIVALDSIVNLVALMVPALFIGAWTQRVRTASNAGVSAS